MKTKLRIVIGTILAIAVAGCSPSNVPVTDPDRLEQQYQYCVEKGGSFSTERNGFSCSLPDK